MATSVLLAALSILPYEHKDKDRTEADSELEKERSVRMASLDSLLTPSATQGQLWHHLSEGLCWQCWPIGGV